jgi:hypothetical protein
MRKVVRCALATAWLASALLVGCGSDPSTEDAGRDASLDATSVDAPGFDAPSLDAPSPDAPSLDAPLDTMPSDAPVDPADAFDAGETCDAVGDACCSEDTCGGGLVCTDDDVCAGTCGASFGEPCCVGSRCVPGLACEPDGVCRFEPCGSRIGATCCIDGPPCVDGAWQCGEDTERCEVCGGPSEACCNEGAPCRSGTCLDGVCTGS